MDVEAQGIWTGMGVRASQTWVGNGIWSHQHHPVVGVRCDTESGCED